jgi:hypothetical protein
MALSKNELIERNNVAIKALNDAVDRLRELRKGKPVDIRARFNREIARANEQITELEIVNAHLKASNTVVEPMSAETVRRLDELAGRLDQAITNDFKINATFDTVLDVLSFAEEIGSLIHQHA